MMVPWRSFDFPRANGGTFDVADITLADDLLAYYQGRDAGYTIRSTIADDGYARSITYSLQDANRTGTKWITLAGSSPNTHGGETHLTSGSLLLSQNGAIPTDLMLFQQETWQETTRLGITSDGDEDRIANSASVYVYSTPQAENPTYPTHPKIYLEDGVIEVVGGLYFDDVEQAAGTWGATGSGAENINDNYFSGAGILTIPPPAGTLIIFK